MGLTIVATLSKVTRANVHIMTPLFQRSFARQEFFFERSILRCNIFIEPTIVCPILKTPKHAIEHANLAM